MSAFAFAAATMSLSAASPNRTDAPPSAHPAAPIVSPETHNPPAESLQAGPVETPLNRFLVDLKKRGDVDPIARDKILADGAMTEARQAAAFLDQALATLSPEYRAAQDKFDAEDYAGCQAIMEKLAANGDPFLATSARFYVIKSLSSRKDFTAALREIDAWSNQRHGDIQRFSYHLPELDFLHGYCLVEDLQYQAGARQLAQFLTLHPDAPDRLVVPARQMLAEIQNRMPGQIGEVGDLMAFAADRLQHQDTGEIVQERQKKALDLLDKLVDEAEKNEQNNSKNSSNSKPAPNRNGQVPQSPMQQSQMPGKGEVQTHLRVRDANPGEAWGALPPADRERILQALRENFPGRYRRLVEQYYEQLAKEP